jgi:hypothetical protein
MTRVSTAPRRALVCRSEEADMRRRVWVAATAAVAVVLVGCGSGDDDGGGAAEATTAALTAAAAPTSAAPVATTEAPTATTGADATEDDWCPVTTEQVSAIVRHEVVSDQTCAWHAPDLAAAVLEVYVSGTDAAHLAGSTETVDGVGDAAAFDVSDALVFERHSAHWVVQIINIGGGSDVVSKVAEVELAKLVVERLG